MTSRIINESHSKFTSPSESSRHCSVNKREKNGEKKYDGTTTTKEKIRRRRIKKEEKRNTIYTIQYTQKNKKKSGVWYIDQSVGSPEFYQAGGSSDLI